MVVLPDQGLSAALLRRQLHQVTNARHVAPRQPPLAAVEGHNFVPIRHVRRRRVLRRLRLAAVMVLMLVVMVVVVVVVVVMVVVMMAVMMSMTMTVSVIVIRMSYGTWCCRHLRCDFGIAPLNLPQEQLVTDGLILGLSSPLLLFLFL